MGNPFISLVLILTLSLQTDWNICSQINQQKKLFLQNLLHKWNQIFYIEVLFKQGLNETSIFGSVQNGVNTLILQPLSANFAARPKEKLLPTLFRQTGRKGPKWPIRMFWVIPKWCRKIFTVSNPSSFLYQSRKNNPKNEAQQYKQLICGIWNIKRGLIPREL